MAISCTTFLIFLIFLFLLFYTECFLFVKQDSVSQLESPCYYPVGDAQTIVFEYYKPIHGQDGWYIEVYRHDFGSECEDLNSSTSLENVTFGSVEFRKLDNDHIKVHAPGPFSVRQCKLFVSISTFFVDT